MATYEALRSLFADSPLRNRLEVATCVKAREILGAGTPPAAVEWAGRVLDPRMTTHEGNRMLLYLLAGCRHLTIEEIRDVEDIDLQEAVDGAVDKLYL